MAEIVLRQMEKANWTEVAELICLGTNYWYQTHGMGPIFTSGPESARLFCEVYETLDPGCCVLAVNEATGKIVGSCFYHPRETHVSLGIMNVHPNYFGSSIARRLLDFICTYADQKGLPVRLVSSAMNLDSFSLYNRAGFVPRMAFQDMFLKVPEYGMVVNNRPDLTHVRNAIPSDVEAMQALEMEISGIARAKDFAYFIENAAGIWHVSVFENDNGEIDGFLISVQHPGSNMIGPGISRSSAIAEALIFQELNHNAGRTPVFLIPVEQNELVKTLYSWKARNCEIHFAQVRGECKPATGVVMPTFMPETG